MQEIYQLYDYWYNLHEQLRGLRLDELFCEDPTELLDIMYTQSILEDEMDAVSTQIYIIKQMYDL